MDPVQEAIESVDALRKRISEISEDGLDLLLRQARTHNAWTDKPVSDDQLKSLYNLVINGPTSGNCLPSRFIFCRTPEAKARLIACVNPGNVAKIEAAPVCVIIGYDVAFWEHLPRLFPHRDMTGPYKDNPQNAETAAFRNGSLQGAYLILAARAMGLDTGAMSGFNNQAVDEEFFAGTTVKSNFLCNIGYGETSGIFQKLPRFDFDEICDII
ncbi:MAG: malonic semialdehyde reductase [Rhodospirillaceae bacterium]|nr:malonic semialdehyde reductase [Rhodospirillaceae bacterium]|tara:strand:+ start:2547 stop:3185 length:639 start_codon:yes stop_codon:yes gene_type:complete